MSESDIDNNDEMGEKTHAQHVKDPLHTSAASPTSSPSAKKDENDYRSDKGSYMNIVMLVLMMCFALSGLTICYSIIVHIFAGVYWQKHGLIRKTVRAAAALSQFFVFTIVSCIVKRELYYRDKGRFSDKFWRRLMSVLCPIISNDSMQPFLTKIEGQNLSEDKSNESWYTKLKHAAQKYWLYGIVIMLFTGETFHFFYEFGSGPCSIFLVQIENCLFYLNRDCQILDIFII
jgi:hypothetical protein